MKYLRMTMPNFSSEALPFVKIGNRRGFTGMQLIENKELADFVKRFPNRFERNGYYDSMLFIEAEAA